MSMISARKCAACGKKKTASGSFCQGCKSKWHHAHKRIEKDGLIVDTVRGSSVSRDGESWWIWDKKGDVLVMGKPSKFYAIKALAFGEEDEDDEDGDEAHKKPTNQLEQEIAAILANGQRQT